MAKRKARKPARPPRLLTIERIRAAHAKHPPPPVTAAEWDVALDAVRDAFPAPATADLDTVFEEVQAEAADEARPQPYSDKLVGNRIDNPTAPMTAAQISKFIWGKENRKLVREWMKAGKLPANHHESLKDHYVVCRDTLETLQQIEMKCPTAPNVPPPKVSNGT